MEFIIEAGLARLALDEPNLARLLGYCPQAPILNRLYAQYYSTTELAACEVAILCKEVESGFQRYRIQAAVSARRERGIHARDAAVAEAILERILDKDPFYRTLSDLVALLRQGEQVGASLLAVGD